MQRIALRERLAEKWQVPLFVLSAVLLGFAWFRGDAVRDGSALETKLRRLDELVIGAQYDSALLTGDRLLSHPELSSANHVRIHLRLAEARLRRGLKSGKKDATAGRRIVEHFHLASAAGAALSGDDFKNIGTAWEWQGQFAAAMDSYRHAIECGVVDPGSLRRRMFEVLHDQLDAPADAMNQLLDENLADPKVDGPVHRLWSIEQKLALSEELGRTEEATALLQKEAASFRNTPHADRFAFIEAHWSYLTDRHDETEAALRDLRNRVAPTDELHAQTGWLLGRTVLSDTRQDRAEEALSFFQSVVEHHPAHPKAIESRIGMAEALARLDRHEESIREFLAATQEFEPSSDHSAENRMMVRAALGVLSELQRTAGRLDTAKAYLHAVTQLDSGSGAQEIALTQQLAQTQARLADDLRAKVGISESSSTPEALLKEVRELHAAAANTYLKLAKLTAWDDRRTTDAHWKAAELFVKAGDLEAATGLFTDFAKRWPSDPLTPRAILEVGFLQQKQMRYGPAAAAFSQLHVQFPGTLESIRGVVPWARCLLNLGPDRFEEAERVLGIVLADSVMVTPRAPEFCDALFLRGEIALSRGEPERAIATLEEAIDRYPRDPRVWPSRFTIADAYRRSSAELRRELSRGDFAGDRDVTGAESLARMRKARDLYRIVIDEYEMRSLESLNRLELLFLRHARLYEADCQFETRDFQTAIKLYEQVAGTMKDSAHALAAFVQIINCHVFLGQAADAHAALARARVLADALPAEVFQTHGSPQTRQDWKNYLEWLEESELF